MSHTAQPAYDTVRARSGRRPLAGASAGTRAPQASQGPEAHWPQARLPREFSQLLTHSLLTLTDLTIFHLKRRRVTQASQITHVRSHCIHCRLAAASIPAPDRALSPGRGGVSVFLEEIVWGSRGNEMSASIQYVTW